jgi:glutaredoxin-like protein NrdH
MITVYSKDNCVQCRATKQKLKDKGLRFVEYNVEESAEAMQYVKNLGYKAAPVVVVGFEHPTMGGKHWSGYDPNNLAAL